MVQHNCKETPRYRIGKDLHVYFTVDTNGEQVELEGRDLSLFLITPNGDKVKVDFEVQSNIIEFWFRGICQKQLGSFSLTLWENKGKLSQSVLDMVDAFELVPLTSFECHD